LKKLISNDLDPGAAIARLNLIESIREPDSQTRLSLDTAIQHALESRREMKLADYDLENREIDVHYAKNQMLPVFNLTATYSQAGLGGRQTIRAAFDDPTIIRIIPGGIGDVFNQLFRFDHLGYATGFDLRIPIKNRAARAEYERALNERQISTQRKAATAQNIVLEVRNAYTQIQKNEARVTSTRITRELALRRLEAEQKKFDLGTSTIRFVLEEQRNLAQAETDEIEALVNYTKALIHYDRAIGNTLQRNNIEIQKQLPSQVLYQN
jgi:outer membrane protein TolC